MLAPSPVRSLICAAALATPLFLPGSAMAVLPDVKNYCIRYAGHATSETMVMQQRGCQIGGPPMWSADNNFHLQWCNSQFGPNPSPQQEQAGEQATKAMENGRIAAIQQCQAQAPAPAPAPAGGGGGTGATLKVVAEVTVYDTFEDGNQDKCYLNPGDTVTLLAPEGATPPWIHVRGMSGQCSGKAGFVYNNGELE